MNMREIEAISEISNYLSFSDAAHGLSYSPSVISKYVSNVEKELGIKIFERGSRANEMSLTPEGRILMRDIQRIAISYRHMRETVKQLKGTYDNILRIGSQPRLGNKVEQEILASFLLQNDSSELEHVRMSSRDLVRLLHSGKLDALLLSLGEFINIDDFFRDTSKYMKADVTLIAEERDMYLGISEKYLPHVEKEARFAEFKDFSFAFAFPSSTDEKEAIAIEPFQILAGKSGFKIRAAYFGTYDSTILKLAARAPIAVAATSIPAQFEGIKFLRVSDWGFRNRVYFVYIKSNNKKQLLKLKNIVSEFRKQTGISEMNL